MDNQAVKAIGMQVALFAVSLLVVYLIVFVAAKAWAKGQESGYGKAGRYAPLA